MEGILESFEFKELLEGEILVQAPQTPEQAAGQLRLQDDFTPPPQNDSQSD